MLKSQTLLKEILVTKVSSGMVFLKSSGPDLNLQRSSYYVTNLGLTITLKALFHLKLLDPGNLKMVLSLGMMKNMINPYLKNMVQLLKETINKWWRPSTSRGEPSFPPPKPPCLLVAKKLDGCT